MGSKVRLASLIVLLGISGPFNAVAVDLARRPVGLVVSGPHVVVANRVGTIQLVNRQSQDIASETRVASQLADLTALPDSNSLLALDPEQSELLLLDKDGSTIQVVARHSVATHPVTVQMIDAGRCLVASLWARQATVVEVDTQRATLATQHVVDLPFAPRQQLKTPRPGQMLLADSFAGGLAVIDCDKGKILSQRSLDGHNIRGLAQSSDGRLLVTHQMLNPHVPTTRERVFWGAVVSNVLRSIAWDEVLPRPTTALANGELSPTRPIHHWQLYPLGQPDRAAGDPGALAIVNDTSLAVCLSGVGELGLDPRGEMNDEPQNRIPVGRRPVALVADPDGKRIWVANQMDDTLTIVNGHRRKKIATVRLSPRYEANLIEQGEQLFYDARLSLDGWMSCHSCHTDGHANGQLNDNLSDGSTETPKRVLSLLGTDATGPWAWNGRQSRLDGQIAASIARTMRGPEHGARRENLDAIAAYLGSLDPPPAQAAARGKLDTEAIARGRKVFSTAGCAVCHQPNKYTTPDVYDVDLPDQAGQREFNPPSLLGVSQRGPYFHDHRATDLHSVLVQHDHAGGAALPAQQRADLLAFLKSL